MLCEYHKSAFAIDNAAQTARWLPTAIMCDAPKSDAPDANNSGSVRRSIRSDDLMAAFLDHWLGQTPVSEEIKQAPRAARAATCARLAPPASPASALRRDVFGASWAAMFVIELVYKAALTEIDAHMPAHVTFLKKYYAAGNFLVSGRKVPRDGGIIVAVGKTRRQVEEIVEEDPFYEHDLAEFRIIEFRASQRAHDIQKRIESC